MTYSRLLAGPWSAVLLVVGLSLCGFSCRQESEPPPKDETAAEILKLRHGIAELTKLGKDLAAEYALGRNSAPYLVVDTGARNVQLKARGRQLRSFAIVETRKPAKGAPYNAVWKLMGKKPLQETERPKIKPGEGEEAAVAAAKQELWAPHRMPTDFDLLCDGGNVLEIRSLPAGQSGSRITRGVRTAYRRTLDWFRRWRGRDPQIHYLLQVWLAEGDAQLLFWSLPKEIQILVR